MKDVILLFKREKVNEEQKYFIILWINKAVTLLETLTDKLKDWRNELCDNVVTKAEQVCNESSVSITKRIRRKRTMPGEYADDSALTVRQEMRRSVIEIWTYCQLKFQAVSLK